MAITYMQRRRSGTYEFRKRLPESMAGKPVPEHVRHAYPDLVNPTTGAFKRELVRSLGTNDSATARKANAKVNHETLEMFERATALMISGARPLAPPQPVSTITPADLEAIEAEALRDCLRQDETARKQDYRATEQGQADRAAIQELAKRKGIEGLVDVTEGSAWGLKPGGLKAHGLGIGILREDFRDFNARQDPSRVEAEVRVALRSRGIKLDPKSEEFREVGLAIIRGTLHGYNLLLDRQEGDTIPTPPPPAPPIFRGPKLSEAYQAWQQGGGASGAKKPSPSSVREADLAVRRFGELHGDIRLGDITKDHARRYRDALAKVPKRLPGRLAKLPLPKLLEQNLKGYEARDAGTVNKLLNLLSAVVSCAEREGDLDQVAGYVNPFDGSVKLRVNRMAKAGREIFLATDLTLLFSSAVFSQGDRPAGGCGEAAFWLPLVGLMSGMRLNEIAGLRIADLKHDDEAGCWFFDIHPWAGRSVKTEGSVRKVPVHPVLVEIGLLRYRQGLRDGGAKDDASLWPAIKSAPGRALSASWSQWFGRYLRTTGGVEDPRKVFHSFRHTWKQMARDAGVHPEQHNRITGHTTGSVSETYGGISMATLAAAMTTIKAPDVLTGLNWQDAGVSDRQASRRGAPRAS